jgi:hypothetical protein
MSKFDPARLFAKYGGFEMCGTLRNIVRGFVAIGLSALALYNGKKALDDYYDEKKSARKGKDPNPADNKKDDEDKTDRPSPLASETLDETLNKPHHSVDKFIGGLITPGEHVFVFSSPNQGKSTLSMQIAIEIASGTRSKIVKEDEPHKPQKVVVYDSEQTEQDILNRYGKFGGFPKNLERVPNCTFNNFSELLKDIEIRLRSINEDVIFVLDNLTNMLPVFSGEPARLFHKGLKNLQAEFRKKGHTITFVIVGHTKKTDPYRLPDVSHIFGSANLGNFANCIHALLPTRFGEGYKMLLPIKARSFKKDGMAIVLRMVDEPYLHFEYEKSALPEDVIPLRPKRTSKEEDPEDDSSDSNHNKEVTEEDVERMKELQQEGKSYREIGEELGVSKKTVSLYIRGIQVPKKKVEQQ